MTYKHGVYISELPTSIIAPITADSAVQVVVGTAPLHLADSLTNKTNVPILANTFAEAAQKLGFSYDFDKWSLCQSMEASFRVYNVNPIVFINVLDPEVHKADVPEANHTIAGLIYELDVPGVLIDSHFVLKVGSTTYNKDEDYTLAHNDDGNVVITVLPDGDIPENTTTLKLSYRKLDPSLVDTDDIIGGYDADTGKFSGLENINRIYPALGLLPGILIAPGYSHKPAVAAALIAKTILINGSFNCHTILDIDTDACTLYTDVKTWKDQNGYVDQRADVCWPMVKVGDHKYYYSAILAAHTAYVDALNNGVPLESPSNKQLRGSGTILTDGTEVHLDQLQGNILNAAGIVTAININGWKVWGNNTSIYPNSTDIKDRFIPCRRMFDWWGNTFILTYFQKVDKPASYRLIETIVDSENIRSNGFKALGQIADAKIVFDSKENPITDILNGTIRFHQFLAFWPPAEDIENILEFDPYALQAALFPNG